MQIVGKLHILLIHLPIGAIVLCLAWHIFTLLKPAHKNSTVLNFLLAFSFFSATLSATSGYFLSQDGSYDPDAVFYHKYLGIALAISSGIAWFLVNRIRNQAKITLILSILVVLLLFTGHQGGQLTHGDDFLSLEENENSSHIADLGQSDVFQDIVLRITKEKCTGCHKPSKKKGGLDLTKIEGWKQGGDNGDILSFGNPASSTIIKQFLLPLEDKLHMPPKSKAQLTPDELLFLKWWIETAENYKHKLADLDPSPQILDYVQSLNSTSISVVDSIRIVELRKRGVKVDRMTENANAELKIDFNGKKIKNFELKEILKMSENIMSLKLSSSDLSSINLRKLGEFSALESLNLSGTSITSSDLSFLGELTNLRSLNLHNTVVDDSIFDQIKNCQKLTTIYLWKTHVTQDKLNEIQSLYPKIEIVGGFEKQFSDVKLLAPKIFKSIDLFEDSLEIIFDPLLRDAQVFYTIDGSNPDSSTTRYSGPFFIEESINIKVRSYKDGWTPSTIRSYTFAKVSRNIQEVKLLTDPAKAYKGEGIKTLQNLILGSEDFKDGEWLGFSKKDLVATMIVDSTKSCSHLTIGTLHDPTSYIFYPRSIILLSSIDGKSYSELSKVEFPESDDFSPLERKMIKLDFPRSNYHYFKVIVKNQGVNPNWHPAPGADSWLFVDEILVD